jgi:hypothetical protein
MSHAQAAASCLILNTDFKTQIHIHTNREAQQFVDDRLASSLAPNEYFTAEELAAQTSED